jgi:predicted RNA-binding protein with PIN domain
MSGKKLSIGRFDYGIEDENFDTVVEQVRNALENGTVAQLPVVTSDKRQVILFLNGSATDAVVIDPDSDGRPHEFG